MKRTVVLAVAVLSMAFGMGGVALAQPSENEPAGGPVPDTIKERLESRTAQFFSRADRDGDGMLSQEEFSEAVASRGPAGRGRGFSARPGAGRPGLGRRGGQGFGQGRGPAYGRPGARGPGFGAGVCPACGRWGVIGWLDADDDGSLSSEEIAKASEALLAHDENEDGALSREELLHAVPPGLRARLGQNTRRSVDEPLR